MGGLPFHILQNTNTPAVGAAAVLSRQGCGLGRRASCPAAAAESDNLGRFCRRVSVKTPFQILQNTDIPNLIASADDCMLGLGFADVRMIFYLAAGDGYA